ncbi:MAG: bis(5'-nucleosyl)-tetraphosphatase (symmetrical) YqeK [Lachnospiraceae bacterium]|nr:bis(5'-nucleosyl)-tetraphosphatase (symmetrical) YqeK [Lachnospiraceae bacterium]
MNKEIQTILDDLQMKMKESRFRHTLGVMHTAASLAYCYEYDANKAMLAAALHDCAKITGLNDYVSECKKYHISFPKVCLKSPHLLHADLGAYFAKEVYHVNDQEILHAIKVHTTGCPNMNLLDKIIFIADYIEPGRPDFDGITAIRYNAFHNIDKAVLLETENVLNYIKKQGFAIDERTVETYNYYKKLIDRR